jgi:hypothetical protein
MNSSLSSSSQSVLENAITYYSEFKDFKSILNPIVSKDVQMIYKGHFLKNWDNFDFTFPTNAYGIKRTNYTRGAIYCKDASKLFAMGHGYIGFTINLPYSITNGIYSPLTTNPYNLFIFGVNTGYSDIKCPGISMFLTNSGIKYTIWSSATKFEMTDVYTNATANEDIFIEMYWGTQKFTKLNNCNVIVRVNQTEVLGGITPINNDGLGDYNFYILDTPTISSPLECTIRNLIIANGPPKYIEDGLYSSTSSSSKSSIIISQSSSSSSSFET